MHCRIILACIALCAAILQRADGFPRDGDVNTKWQRHGASCKTVDRQRRSLWSELADHFNVLTDAFRARPVLAAGNADDLAGSVGEKLRIMFGTGSKGNAMFSEDFPGETQAQFTARKWFAHENNRITDPMELSAARSEMTKINELHGEAVTVEQQLLQYLVNNSKKNQPKDNRYIRLLLKGVSKLDSETTIRQILKDHPQLKERLINDTKTLLQMRKNLQIVERKFTKDIMLRLTEEELNQPIYNDMNLIRFFNDNWIEFVTKDAEYLKPNPFEPESDALEKSVTPAEGTRKPE